MATKDLIGNRLDGVGQEVQAFGFEPDRLAIGRRQLSRRRELKGSTGETFPVPPLAAENHVCSACDLAYRSISVQDAVLTIRTVAQHARTAIDGVAPAALGHRPESGVWSVAEYVCHLRDVYVTYTIRLYRARTENRPQVEPMLNDLRAQRFRYSERDVLAVLDELHATAHGFCEEIGGMRPDDWTRVVSRLPGEERTALWLVRQAMHEGVHHLNDISQVKAWLGLDI